MERDQMQATVAATKTLYENFLEEKCECDFIIPDYYPAAEKIIQCSAWPIILKKEVEGDRIVLEGICRFLVIYHGEDDCGIKALSESVNFAESFPLKDSGTLPWVQAVVRVSGNSCRLLNGRKISARANVSIALKVKDQQKVDTLEGVTCEGVETLLEEKSVYAVLEHPNDTFKVQGEIEVHSEIQDVLKTEGVVCIKDIKVMSGKAIIKGILDLYILYTTEEDPCHVEHTSTAIPFSQVLEIASTEENAMMDASANIINLRADVESDDSGKNRIISVCASVWTEGEVFANNKHQFLIDAYSNCFPMEMSHCELSTEELLERDQLEESMIFEFPLEGEDMEIIQTIGAPLIRKITGNQNALMIEGVLDMSIFLRDGAQYRSVDKSFPFTLKKGIEHLESQMRCEVSPCLIGTEWSIHGDMAKIKAEMCCRVSVFSKQTTNVIQSYEIDTEHRKDESSFAVVIYYAEKGERLWDIARRYATSVSMLQSVNDGVGDVIEDKRMLLISR